MARDELDTEYCLSTSDGMTCILEDNRRLPKKAIDGCFGMKQVVGGVAGATVGEPTSAFIGATAGCIYGTYNEITKDDTRIEEFEFEQPSRQRDTDWKWF